MRTFSFDEIDAALEKTHPAIEELLFSPSLNSILSVMVKKYSLTRDQSIDIAALVFYYLTKLISDQEFVNEAGALIPQNHFGSFMKDLQEMVWDPFDAYLAKGNIVYKQLTKLEPQPVEKPQPAPPTLQEQKPRTAPTPAPAPVPAPVAQPQQKPQPVIPPVPAMVPVAQVPQKPPEVIVMGQQNAAPGPTPASKAQPQGPAAPAMPYVPSQAPRVKVGESKISQQTPAINVPKPPQPIFQGIQFQSLQETPSVPREVQGTGETKPIAVPPAPVIPKATVQGKEVIDLTDFSVNSAEKPNP